MKYLHAMMMCFSMFCYLPSPYKKWDEEARPLVNLFLPAVGLFTGALWTGLAYLLDYLVVPGLVTAAVLTSFPFLITGGIHMDGFLDVTDAVRSWRGPEERRRILKDPNIGSFAMLYGAVLILLMFSLFASVKEGVSYFALILISVSSRASAGLFVTVLRPMDTSEYAGLYRKEIRKGHAAFFISVLIAAALAGFLLLGRYGFTVISVFAVYTLFLIRPFKALDGMSGDISGYAMTVAELAGVAVMAIV